VVTDRPEAEADLVIVREASLLACHPLGRTMPARIGQIPVPLGAVLGIAPINQATTASMASSAAFALERSTRRDLTRND